MAQNIIARSIALGPVLQQLCVEPINYLSDAAKTIGNIESWYVSCDNKFIVLVAKYDSGEEYQLVRQLGVTLFGIFRRYGLYNIENNTPELRRTMTAQRPWIRAVSHTIPDIDSTQFVTMSLPDDFVPGAVMVSASLATADGYVVSMTEIDTPDEDKPLTEEQLHRILGGTVLRKDFEAIVLKNPEIAEDVRRAFSAHARGTASPFNEALGV